MRKVLLTTLVLMQSAMPFFCAQAFSAETPPVPSGLRTELLVNPIGLDTAKPRFSWRLETARTGAAQRGFQIQAASSPEELASGRADLWDSGWVVSDDNAQVEYAGRTLAPFQPFFWRVRVREENGHETGWSAAARAEPGPLSSADWKEALWLKSPEYPADISEASVRFIRYAVTRGGAVENARGILENILRPMPLFRRSFDLPFKPVRARVYLSAVGYADLRINGEAANDRVLDPAYTHYPVRRLFVSTDVTDRLRQGENVLGVIPGPGYAQSFFKVQPDRAARTQYGRPEVRLLLFAEGPRGEQVWITTDNRWKCAEGPIRRSHLYIGEQYDARKELPGWDAPGFDDSAWGSPDKGEPFAGLLEAMLQPPERVVKTLRPVAVQEPAPGVFVFELPETVSGWPVLKICGAEAGQTVILRVSQSVFGQSWVRLDPKKAVMHYDDAAPPAEGMIFKDNYTPLQSKAGNADISSTYAYTCRGGEPERWTPRFAYHPVRYIEVTGYPGRPTVDDISFEAVCTDFSQTGEADPGNPVMRELQQKFLDTILYCSHGVLQDNANHERGGWTWDAFMAYPLLSSHYDIDWFADKFLGDIRANSREDGLPSVTCPSLTRGLGEMSMDWNLSSIMIAWEHYVRTGDRRSLEKHYPSMESTLRVIWKLSGGTIDGLRGFGDWLDAEREQGSRPPSPWKHLGEGVNLPLHTSITLSAGSAFVQAAQQTAAAARLFGKDPSEWEGMGESFRKALVDRFFKDGSFGSQTGDIEGITCGLLTKDEEIASAAAGLNRNITEEWNGHPNVGFHGTRDIAMVLGAHGYADTARDIFLVEGYPGWRYATSGKRTTIGPVWTPSIARQIQHARGAAGRWFANGLAGINPSEEGPGYHRFILAPQIPAGHPSASARLMTLQGEIVSSWVQEGEIIRWNITVPWNTSATVKLPGFRTVLLNGQPVGKNEFGLSAGLWEVVLTR